PTKTFTPTPTFTPTETTTPTPSSTPTITPTPTPTDTATNTSTPTSTSTSTVVPTPTATACTLQFEDAPPGSTFYAFIRCLACRGIISGYDCGGSGEPCIPPNNDPYFRPASNITRGQLSKVVSNAAGWQETHTEQS